MKTTLYWQTPRPVSRLFFDSGRNSTQQSWKTQLNRFWNVTFARLADSTEPRVWQTCDASGRATWNAYDAQSEQAIYQVPEDEMRIWLEDLHYRDQAIAQHRQERFRVWQRQA